MEQKMRLNISTFTQKRVFIGLLLGMGVTLIVMLLSYTELMKAFELKTLDYRFLLRGPRDVTNDIVIVAVDDVTTQELKWPISRDLYASLVDYLSKYGAGVLAFDILFSDPDTEHPEYDVLLSQITANAGNVLHSMLFRFESSDQQFAKTVSNEDMQILTRFSLPKAQIYPTNFSRASSILPFLPDLLASSKNIGHVNMQPDNDGTTRCLELVVKFNGHLYPALSLAVVCNYLNIEKTDMIIRDGVIDLGKTRLGRIKIPIDRRGRILVNYSHREGSYTLYSFLHVLQKFKAIEVGESDSGFANSFKDKIVLIGMLTSGGVDIRSTPISPSYPALQIHADVMDSILQRKFLTRLPTLWNLAFLLLLGFSMSIILPLVRPMMKLLLFIFALTICVAIACVLFVYAGVWLNLFSPMLASTLVFLCITSHDYFRSLLYEQVMERELSIARQIQIDLLPKKEPQLKGFDISALSKPHRWVGGDYYDFIKLDNDRLGIVIGDASGKSVPASLLVTNSRAALRAYMENVDSLANVLVKLNNFVYRDTDADKYVTFFCCIIDVSEKKLIYSSAGHNPAFLYHSNDGSFEALESRGMPVGMFENAPYDESEIHVADGDILVIYTDGVTEAENKKEEAFGEERLRNIIRAEAGSDSRTLRDRILSEITDFSGSRLGDDVTIIVIKVKDDEQNKGEI
jgi:CHASE2 domain-containing sensor protein